jgi:hypothetical protein
MRRRRGHLIAVTRWKRVRKRASQIGGNEAGTIGNTARITKWRLAMMKKLAAMMCGLAAIGLLGVQADAATAVGPGSGHPWVSDGSIFWSTANAGNAAVSDNFVCYRLGGGGSQTPQSWIVPLAMPTSTVNRVSTITQVRSSASKTSNSQAWSFNPNGSAFMGIAESSATLIGNLTVPPGGTAFSKHFLSFDVDAGTGCIYTVTSN